MYETIKKFLAEGGKCLLIENGKPAGVILTMEEYEKLRRSPKGEVGVPTEASGLQNKSDEPTLFDAANKSAEPAESNPVGEAMVKEMDYKEASANIDEINLADAEDITLEDLGLDELPY